MRQFTTNYDRYRDRIVNLSGVQCPSSQVRHADEDCKYEGSVDDAVSIDIHAVVCADIMMHGPSSLSDHMITVGISYLKYRT
jgi:hypothetical protein